MFDFRSLFQRTSRPADDKRVHLSFARSGVGRTISRTGVLLRKQTWVFPIIAIAVLLVGGFFLRRSIERAAKENLSSGLQTLLNVESAMIETWLRVQESNAQTQATDLEIRNDVYKLLDLVDPTKPAGESLLTSPIHAQLRKSLGPAMAAHDYTGYMVLDRSRKVLSSNAPDLLGRIYSATEIDDPFRRALDGESIVTQPFPSMAAIVDEKGKTRVGVPTMWALSPVRDESFQTVAVLALRIRPEDEFTRVLQLGQIGNSGETYAFDNTGRLVSNSRFDEQLILLGIIPDTEDSQSILNVQLRDPGGDMTQGFRPTVRRSELPLTKSVADAVLGHSGIDIEGYSGYRGVRKIGAWKWLPKYEIGLVTEMDADEAFGPLLILRGAFFTLLGMLALASLAIFLFSVRVAKMRREAQKSAIASQKLGQYTLEKKLGAGGMGVVYKGLHAVLRRPTAIKLLNVDKVNEGTIERFEREVQITSQLNHPNTVAIYDYGRTEEGIFYYAMEYIEGIDLQQLVEKYGAQSEARVIHILRQVCGSLYEAHSLGLVHRDIKPANIMLARRGGEPDVAKVLDFGLVKALDEKQQSRLTAAGSMTGTPLYMSPEAIQTPDGVDSRSDLYALGAVGYYLLTGKPVFDAENIVELCQAHVTQMPLAPSERLGHPVSTELEGALMACLDKSRAKRPQTARDLSALLSRSAAALQWSVEDADNWWGRHERGLPQASTNGGAASATMIAPPGADTSRNLGQTVITNEE
jgi:eukaryotic-like serine/threonine-protein kinase